MPLVYERLELAMSTLPVSYPETYGTSAGSPRWLAELNPQAAVFLRDPSSSNSGYTPSHLREQYIPSPLLVLHPTVCLQSHSRQCLSSLLVGTHAQDVFASDDGKRALAADAATAPVSKAIDAIEKEVVNQKSLLTTSDAAMTALSRDFTAARLRFNAVRYDSEARLNQVVANIYELQVRKSNVSAERHHQRSQRFFFGMLAAQMGVIIATFAMAAKQRNLLWSLATGAGVVAIAFAIYVYLYV